MSAQGCQKSSQYSSCASEMGFCGFFFLKGQKGQALAEMAICLSVLVLLAVGVMLLGQYMHVRQGVQGAARQAAWAATVDPALANKQIPDASRLQEGLRARRFGSAKTVIESNVHAPTVFASPMLVTFAGKSLLKPAELTLNVYKQESSPSYVDKAIDIVGKAAKAFHLGNSLPPNSKGLVTAEVHARTEPITGSNGDALDFLGDLTSEHLDFSARSVLLADAWNASGGGEKMDGSFDKNAIYADRTVRGVIRPMVPSEWLPGADSIIGKAVNILGKIPLIDVFITAGMDKFEPGRAAPDVVPADKLVDYKNVP